MCNINRLSRKYLAFIIACLPIAYYYLPLPIVSAFTTSFSSPYSRSIRHHHHHRGDDGDDDARQRHDNPIGTFINVEFRNIEQNIPGKGNYRLSAEPNSRTEWSRRRFVDYCAITMAGGSVVATAFFAPSTSIAQTTTTSIASSTTATYDASNNNNNNIIIRSTNDNAHTSTTDSNQLLSSSIQNNEPTAFQESISGLVSGSFISIVKTLIKYPLDTATVRLQMPSTPYTIRNLPALFSGGYDGIAAPLVSNVPAGAAFFAVKDLTKSLLKDSEFGSDLPKWALTALAVGAAQPLYWLLRNPSEVIKTRLQVGAMGYYEGMSALDAFRLALSNGGGGGGGEGGRNNSTMMDGVGELYQGYAENILYAFPADIIKFVAYDSLTGGGSGGGKKEKEKNKVVSAAEGAVCGALSTAISQLVTTPLDVLRNRIMAEVPDGDDNTKASTTAGGDANKVSYLDRVTKIVKEEGAGALFAGSSPRVAKALLSGAIQFATYEETKQKMAELFMKR